MPAKYKHTSERMHDAERAARKLRGLKNSLSETQTQIKQTQMELINHAQILKITKIDGVEITKIDGVHTVVTN